ncbi:MAG TPA: class I SAM-dependent methyltransferase [Rhodoferax sp.]|nr:class I SAM-dependent methyltransferase [Rhodoferax sp.]
MSSLTETAPGPHGSLVPSAWIQRWSHLVPARGTVLDVACGYGRHLRWFAQRNHPVAGVDRSQEAIDSIANLAAAGQAEALVADLENGPWPFSASAKVRTFDAVVVTNYLWRPLLPAIVGSVAPGGVLIYETFAAGNETVGKPSRADFLLQPGELLRACAGLRVVAFEDGFLHGPDRFVQRIVAVRESDRELPARYPL